MEERVTPSPAKSWCDLLCLSDEADFWAESDLRAILRHQLDAPLLFDVGGVQAATGLNASGIRSFIQLLDHPKPPVDLLKLTKDFAKASDHQNGGPLPQEIGTALYYGTILAARLRCATSISSLSDRELCEGVDWALEQPWLDERLHPLFRAGLDSLCGGRGA